MIILQALEERGDMGDSGVGGRGRVRRELGISEPVNGSRVLHSDVISFSPLVGFEVVSG